jgi:hypothetical protein
VDACGELLRAGVEAGGEGLDGAVQVALNLEAGSGNVGAYEAEEFLSGIVAEGVILGVVGLPSRGSLSDGLDDLSVDGVGLLVHRHGSGKGGNEANNDEGKHSIDIKFIYYKSVSKFNNNSIFKAYIIY